MKYLFNEKINERIMALGGGYNPVIEFSDELLLLEKIITLSPIEWRNQVLDFVFSGTAYEHFITNRRELFYLTNYTTRCIFSSFDEYKNHLESYLIDMIRKEKIPHEMLAKTSYLGINTQK